MKNLVLPLFIVLSFSSFAQKEELRGAWIATYSNIDYPVRGQSPQQQQAHFVSIIESLANAGFNAVYVQIRSQADAMYPSAFEPWSADLTGTQGKAPEPYWDPLQFMITETHKRGLEFHAWINPYRVSGNSANLAYASPGHISRTQPGWLLRFGSLVTLDPGIPAVRDYIVKVVGDITRRYDVDGIHFDDYFYPDPAVNDNKTFAAYKRGIADKANWRRDNVDLLIKSVFQEIRSIKSWVKFGVSPSGIYRNSPDYRTGTNTTGLEHYSQLYADTKKWIEQGWIDYLEPQVYWSHRQPGARFGDIVPWWNSVGANRHIYIGLAAYKVERRGQYGWSDPSELPSQVRFTRQQPLSKIHGHAVYNTSSILKNELGLFDSLKILYASPALVPEMKWVDAHKPAAPASLQAIEDKGKVELNWSMSSGSQRDMARRILVYRSETASFNLNDPDQLIAILPPQTRFYDTTAGSRKYYYAVSVVDRTSNESELSNIAFPGQGRLPFTLVDFTLEETSPNRVKLSWKAAHEESISRYELEKSTANGPFSVFAIVKPGISTGAISYTVEDTSDLKGVLTTYRLQVTDLNGIVIHSKPLTVSARTQPVIVSVSVPPIKADSQKTVAIQYIKQPQVFTAGRMLSVVTNDKGNFSYDLYSGSGEKLTSGKIRSVTEGIRIALPGTATLTAGKYRLEISDGKSTQNFIIDIK